ncbi:MAG: cobyrinate a,c-diamide synthase [Candidatus Krumholzibacteriia bacterium]
MRPYPRLLVAGTGGDAGKTLVSLALIVAFRDDGLAVAAFKKGPDFIDAAWLGWAAGRPGRNLDTYMVGADAVELGFRRRGEPAGLNLIEGNRGLLDGLDAEGTHSSAALARLTRTPVVLVTSPVKVTATAAATVLGLQKLAPGVEIAGVILNRVSGERHRQVVTRAIEEHTGVPVLGAIPRVEGPLLTSRHLGLVPPAEHGPAEELRRTLADLARAHVDLGRLREVAQGAVPLEPAGEDGTPGSAGAGFPRPRIGYFSDSAFTFYYPENLEALEREGAELTAVSALGDTRLPELDALYIGGGFPETHTAQLAGNRVLHADLRRRVKAGLPVYAECGGLMYLAERLETADGEVELAGVLPVRVKLHRRPQGHGYSRVIVDAPNPIFPVGTELQGHEFHYSALSGGRERVATAYRVEKGSGVGEGRDGIVHGQVLASYLHLHAHGTPAWARGLTAAARTHAASRNLTAGDSS